MALASPARFASAEFFRFLVAGALGFAIDSGLLLVFVHGLGWAPAPARLASFTLALTSTWLINRLWTFRSAAQDQPARRMGAEFLGYGAVQITGGAANFIVYVTIVALTGEAPMQLLAALAAGSAIGLAINYLGARHFVFRPRA